MPRRLVVLAIVITVLGHTGVDGYRKFENGRPIDNGIEEGSTATASQNPTPLSSRIRKLPSRYAQHYFTPFQPAVSTETKTWMTFPTSAANFFGPQSYWAQLADKLINTVGGTYAQYATNLRKKKPKSDRLALFRQALKIENSTRIHQGRVMGRQRLRGNGVDGLSSAEVERVTVPTTTTTMATTTTTTEAPIEVASKPNFDESTEWQPAYTESDDYSSTEATTTPPKPAVPSATPTYVKPTRFPPPPQTTTLESPYGVLPNLLMRDPNARSKFYHLDRVANPQVRPTELNSNRDRSNTKVAYPRISTEIRRKPAIKPAIRTESSESKSESDFRAALRRVFSDFRKHQGAVTTTTTTTEPPEFRETLTSREEMLYARLAQLKAARANRRRHPGNSNSSGRRIVILPSRYDGDDNNNFGWRH